MATLEFKDLQFSAHDSRNKKRIILDSVSGILKPNELTAIMGPSGAGKTSLLNILSGRVGARNGNIKGTVLLAGDKINPVQEVERFAYVEQEDALYPTATVKESIYLSARLRKIEQPVENTNKTMEILGLQKCADTLCGSAMIKGISGGEKRRTSIGVELVSNPEFIFLDEPTSGLDSFAAYNVVQTLKTVAKNGNTVTASIHQPSSEIFASFDNAIFMAEGKIMYQGPASEVDKWFTSLNYPCPNLYNVCDHVMFVIQTISPEETGRLCDEFLKRGGLPNGNKAAATSESATVEVGESATVEVGESATVDVEANRVNVDGPMEKDGRGDLKAGTNGEYSASEAGAEASVTSMEVLPDIKARKSVKVRTRPSYLLQMQMLSLREFRDLWRDKGSLIARFVITLILQGLYGIIFTNAADNTADDYNWKSHFGAITMVSIGTMFGAAQPELLVFPMKRPAFMREYTAGMYSSVCFVIAKTFVELPLLFAQCCFIMVLCWFSMGFQAPFFQLTFGLWIMSFAATGSAFFISALTTDIKKAMELGPLLLVPQILFAGFFISINQIPEYIRWARYICFLKYGMDLFIVHEFKEPVWAPCLGDSAAQCDSSAIILEQNEISLDEEPFFIGLLCAMAVGFRVLGIIGIRVNYTKR